MKKKCLEWNNKGANQSTNSSTNETTSNDILDILKLLNIE